MFSTAGFPQAPLAFAFPGQQPQMSLYQSQFGGVAGFNPSLAPPFQTGPPASAAPRGQSLPASGRQYLPQSGPYAPGQTVSSRRQHHDAHPPPAPSQHYEYHSNHGSKSKKHHKRRSVSPGGAGEPGLYSDKERRDVSEAHQERSRSPSPALVSRSKQDEVSENQSSHPHQQQSPTEGTAQGESGATVARSEELQANVDQERRKSSSKKKKHHRRDRHENYHVPPNQGQQPPEINPNQPFPGVYQTQQPFLPQQPIFSEYQNELPPQLKVHRQPLYSGYNQAYEESIRRGDVYRKQAKRSTRLPPEVKQKLLPHEDDQPNPSSAPQGYSYAPAPAYPQAFPAIRPPFNPYQPYANQGGYFNPNPAPTGYNSLQPWTNVAAPTGPSSEQEIQRLRSHIHTLEGELHKLQRKLNKTNITSGNNEGSDQSGAHQHEEKSRSHRRSKRDEVGSPRQTPVIVELNSTPAEAPVRTSSKKHRHRTASNTSSQQGTHLPPPDPSTAPRPVETNVAPVTTQATTEVREQSRPPANLSAEVDERQTKSSGSKSSREETASQLAHAAAAHVNGRQGGNVANVQQHATVAPPPPHVGRPQLPPQQQQQQQQFLYQQGAVRPQGPPIRGPAPQMPMQGNIRYPVDPHRQGPPVQQVAPHQPTVNPNYNQSNNNELFDDPESDERGVNVLHQEEQNRSAEKILDAFERFYVHSGKSSSAPMKVKFIPENNNSHSNIKHPVYPQGNINNNNNNNNVHPPPSQQLCRQSSSSASSSSYSSSESLYSNSPISSRRSTYDNNNRTTAAMKTGPFI